MNRDQPILEYQIFVNTNTFAQWQRLNPNVVVFNTQFFVDADNNDCLGVVYTVREDKPAVKAEELTTPIDTSLN